MEKEMITLRLDSDLEQTVNNIAKQMGISKSELIRKSLTDFIEKLEQPSAWELGSELFGKHGSGTTNLSQDRKAILKDKIKAKR